MKKRQAVREAAASVFAAVSPTVPQQEIIELLELTRLRGHLILGEALEEGAHIGSSVEVSAGVPS